MIFTIQKLWSIVIALISVTLGFFHFYHFSVNCFASDWISTVFFTEGWSGLWFKYVNLSNPFGMSLLTPTLPLPIPLSSPLLQIDHREVSCSLSYSKCNGLLQFLWTRPLLLWPCSCQAGTWAPPIMNYLAYVWKILQCEIGTRYLTKN